jgi:uncharacterized protein (UPF0332 family)
MFTPEQAAKVASHLKLADGFMQTAEGYTLSSEYAIRNSISRLYYAFFHASLALLHTVRSDVEQVSRNHGSVHKEVEKRIGRPIGRRLRRLAEFRRRCDYEADLFQKKYGGNIEEAQNEAMAWLRSSRRDFYWIYHEARKELRNQ